MELSYDTRYPAVDDLRERARHRIPRFAFEYLDGGCNEEVNLRKNTEELRRVELKPLYLSQHVASDTRTELFGQVYDAPFGVAPIGLQGLIWPNSPAILAKAAISHNIPFILSTVSTASIEQIGKVTDGKFWFQLYHPREDRLRDDLLDRAEGAGCQVLAALCDVPTFGFRPKDIRNGLAMPPNMSVGNILQILGRPNWVIQTLRHGKPRFATMQQYFPKNLNIKQLGKTMNETFAGRLSEAKLAPIRDRWKGKLLLKGVASIEDAEMAIRLGLDGIILSNHGGRQLDAGQSTIATLPEIASACKGRIAVAMDSGIRTGPDIARTLASGADFAFLGRTFMYAVAALGEEGGHHIISMLKIQLKQVMEQVCCERVGDFPRFLVR